MEWNGTEWRAKKRTIDWLTGPLENPPFHTGLLSPYNNLPSLIVVCAYYLFILDCIWLVLEHWIELIMFVG